jgi:hypothetical protein
MDLALNDADGALIDVLCIVILFVSLYERFAAVYCQSFGETVTGNGYDADLDLRDVFDLVHGFFSFVIAVR